ncbi:MAG: DNA polymerase I [Verrucomicrobiae bacterium]|nr:DNA polymerase I [Verrucomicrobiae bacterium]
MADEHDQTSSDHRLFLLDGMALIYRAHFALIRSPIFSSTGINTSAIFGFTNTLLDLLEKQKPTHIAVAFDTAEPTPRHQLFPDYKAQREEMPEDIGRAIPAVKRLIKAFDIPVLECPGFEADDIIGTLAKRAEAEGGYTTFMVTPDKDFAQLVSERTVIYKPGRQGSEAEILDLAKIREQWQVESPEQVIDILGLWGDASDNIPGVPGIGEKTAKKLISQFGSVENLLAHTNELKGKQKENVEANAEQAKLSRKLAEIILDAPVDVDFHQLSIGEKRDDEALRSLFVEFEFNAIGKRIFGDDFAAGRGHSTAKTEGGELVAELKTIEDVEKNYQRIQVGDTKGRAKLIEQLSGLEAFCFDVETDGLDEKTTRLLGIAFSWEKDAGFYAEIPKEPGEAEAVLREFRPVLESESIEKIGHNLKFDVSVLYWQGVRVGGTLFDTMLAHTLIEPDQRHRMDYLSETYLGYTPISYDEAFGKPTEKTGQLTMFDEPAEDSGPDPEKVARYAAEDADVTWQLAGILRDKLKDAGQEKVFFDIESPLLPVLVRMEGEGVRIDTGALKEIGDSLAANMATLEAKVYAAAGTEFNLNSPKQVGEVLFDRLNLVEKPKKTKTGQYKTDEQTLTQLAVSHEIVADLLAFREAAKLKGTYVDTLPEAIFERTGRVHTTFHQLMTATGRLASNNPNLQNIPIRTAQGREIRKAFVPRDADYVLFSADYSQIELRVMASLSGDPGMMEAFEAGHDIHTITAARVYGLDLNEVEPDMRRTAKMVNFGIIYGISAFGLSQRLGTISRSEAGDIIEEYWRQYPKVKEYMESTVEFAQKNGYVETVTGRRRYLRDINSRNATVRGAAERTAINTPIQGTAADMIKIAMVTIDGALRDGGYRSRMILQVHDELVFDLHRDEQDTVIPLVEKGMRDALPLKVPVVVESGTGENWLAAH